MKNLKRYREQCGLTQRELAKELGVTQAFVSQLENSDLFPGRSIFSKILTYFDVTSDQILGTEHLYYSVDKIPLFEENLSNDSDSLIFSDKVIENDKFLYPVFGIRINEDYDPPYLIKNDLLIFKSCYDLNSITEKDYIIFYRISDKNCSLVKVLKVDNKKSNFILVSINRKGVASLCKKSELKKGNYVKLIKLIRDL